MRVLAYLFFTFFAVLFASNLYAQCCAAGTPNCDNSLSNGSNKKILALSIANVYSYSDQYFKGTEVFPSNYMKNSSFHFGSMRASYGVSDKLKVVLDFGYFFSKAQTLEKNNYFREARGMSDVGITAVYTLYDKNKFQLSPIARVTLPFGQFDQKFGPVILPIDLQPSAGSLKTAGGFFATHKTSEKVALSLLGTYEVSNEIKTEHTSYKYGDLMNARLMANYNISSNLSAGCHGWYQYRNRAEDESKNLVNATGGHLFFICPTLSYDYKTWRLTGRYERPIYKNVNGTQLTNKHRFALRLTRVIDLNKNHVEDTVTLSVAGICSMCKARIETTALSFPSVLTANWDVVNQQLIIEVTSDFEKNALVVKLLEAGHDSDGKYANSESYNLLHSCCKYRTH